MRSRGSACSLRLAPQDAVSILRHLLLVTPSSLTWVRCQTPQPLADGKPTREGPGSPNSFSQCLSPSRPDRCLEAACLLLHSDSLGSVVHFQACLRSLPPNVKWKCWRRTRMDPLLETDNPFCAPRDNQDPRCCLSPVG